MLEDKRQSPRSFLHRDAPKGKRLKPDGRLLSSPPNSSRDRKDKQLGDKIVALQQLVSPYGKTDTASVLQEAMDYISFLHDQLKVLSAPYLLTASLNDHRSAIAAGTLRGRGLCLVPVSATAAIDRNNGADLWAPTKTTAGSPNPSSQQQPISPFRY